MSIGRRTFIAGGLALGASACASFERRVIEPITKLKIDPVDRVVTGSAEERFRMFEASGNGMLGVTIFNSVTGVAIGYNDNRRFGHASSFKLSLAAMVLARGAAGLIDPGKRVRWSERDLMGNSPFTTERVGEGASLIELAEATQKTSDNAAANILLKELGGPAAVTAFWRSIGDDVSRLDRNEPTVNNVPIAEYRDTTTPAAMARNVARLLYGEVMPEAERATLRQWMIDTQTGLKRVRAGLREDANRSGAWVAGDKTGTSLWPGNPGLYIDIGFAEPPPTKTGPRAPVTFAAYFRSHTAHDSLDPQAEAVFAKIGDVIRDFAIEDDGWPF